MKKLIALLLSMCQILTISAQKKDPKWVEKAGSAIFTIKTTDKDGTTKTGCGFFIGADGEAVSSYNLFDKAEKAEVTLSGGETLQVSQILGADDFYDVIRFKVSSIPKKQSFLTVATSPPIVNSTAILIPYTEVKSLTQGTITEISKINGKYDYYSIDMALPSSQVGFPLFNEAGEAFAMTQSDASGKGKTFGISLPYMQNLTVKSLDMLKKSYSGISIRKAWSSDIDESTVSLMLYASQQDAQTYLETLNDFIKTFPDRPEGYLSRASLYAFRRDELATDKTEQLKLLDLSWKDLDTAAKNIESKSEAYFNKARFIFDVISGDSTIQLANWNKKTMEENLNLAIAEEDRPLYRKLEADIAFNKGSYEKAGLLYSAVNKTDMASGASFYLEAKSKQQIAGHDPGEIISLIDSAITRSPLEEATIYLVENAELQMQAGLYAQAAKNYTTIYNLLGKNVSDEFYYLSEQAKYRSGDLIGALSDIDNAITLNSTNATYHAEKASIHLRLEDLPGAQKSAEKAIQLEPEFASAYRLLGVSLMRQDKKTEACNQFNKAKELGDTYVERLIKENCN